jgi:putative SOS response-associated peptidase YedK
MCSRFTLSKEDKELEQTYHAKVIDPFAPNYNIAPTDLAPIIRADKPDQILHYHWGIIPWHAKEKKISYSTINARTDKLLSSPLWKPLMLSAKRCIVLADGFYDWETTPDGEKLPYRFTLKNEKVMSMAGLWEGWKDPKTGELYHSFTIVTIDPNEKIGAIHDRMPVILTKEEEKIWLSKDVPLKDLIAICDVYPPDQLNMTRVSKKVNATSTSKRPNNSPDLIQPMDD